MNVCRKCKTLNPNQTIRCIRCKKVIAGQFEVALCLAIFAISLPTHYLVFKIFGIEGGLLREAVLNSFFVYCVSLLALKVWQKTNEPRRMIVIELVAMYSDRFGRLAMLSGVLFVLYVLAFNQAPRSMAIYPVWYEEARTYVHIFGLSIFVVYVALYLYVLRSAALNPQVEDAIVSVPRVRKQFMDNEFINKIVRYMLIEEAQGGTTSQLDFFIRAHAQQYDLSPESAKVLMSALPHQELELFKRALRPEFESGMKELGLA